MPETILTVEHEVGLHARPAALFIKTAKQFQCDVLVSHGDKEANAKSILSLISLGVEQGSVITIRTDGPDEDQALETLAALVRTNFGESK